jgi:hypothetical protein
MLLKLAKKALLDKDEMKGYLEKSQKEPIDHHWFPLLHLKLIDLMATQALKGKTERGWLDLNPRL